jgi:hypothetical protein
MKMMVPLLSSEADFFYTGSEEGSFIRYNTKSVITVRIEGRLITGKWTYGRLGSMGQSYCSTAEAKAWLQLLKAIGRSNP